ncbi:MAG: hypothetical protein HZA50_06300 [Planctomycetes bacterium]|nr:hypothetical protein [Planctomycetota bacterium]
MKRFAWSLQRLLDITGQREKVLKAELADLSARIVQVRKEIERTRAELKELINDLSKMAFDKRMSHHETFMSAAGLKEDRIAALGKKSQDLKALRETKKEQLIKLMNSRRTLERLRHAALQRHVKEQRTIEQKQLDEVGGVAHVRRMKQGKTGS